MIERSGRGGVDRLSQSTRTVIFVFLRRVNYAVGGVDTESTRLQKNFLYTSSFPFLPRLLCIKNKHSSRINLGIFTTLKSWVAAHLLNPEVSRPVAGLSTMISLLAQNGVAAKSIRPFARFVALPSYFSLCPLGCSPSHRPSALFIEKITKK
jgi:hypothetical protein